MRTRRPMLNGLIRASEISSAGVATPRRQKQTRSNSGSRISFIPTVTLTRSGREASTAAAGSSAGNCRASTGAEGSSAGNCRASTASTLAPSLARLASAHGTPVRSPSIPASRLAHPIRAPPGPRSSRPAVRLSPSATYRGQLPRSMPPR